MKIIIKLDLDNDNDKYDYGIIKHGDNPLNVLTEFADYLKWELDKDVPDSLEKVQETLFNLLSEYNIDLSTVL